MLNPVLAQIPTMTGVGVKINAPTNSVSVPVGDLTIYGASSDNNSTNCQVYADWNDLKPMQIVTANGPNGDADYSKWSYTYNGDYHDIVEGPNELTSKITCYDQVQKATSSKSYSINVTGTKAGSEIVNNTGNQSTVSEDTKILPVKSSSSNNDSSNDTVETSTESTDSDSEDTKILPVKSSSSNNDSSNDSVETSTESTDSDSEDTKILPVKSSSSNDDSSNDTVETSTESTDSDSEDTKILPVKSSSSNDDSSNDTVETSTESTDSDSEDTNVIPVKNILPLYSESNEESTKSVSSADYDETEVANTDTVELQDKPTSNETIDTDSETNATLSSGQQGEMGESKTIDMSEFQAAEGSDEAVVEDQFSNNDENTLGASPNTDSSFSNYDRDNDSIFGLKFNGPDDFTDNKIEKRIEKLEDRIDDRVQLFDLIG
jgi:hypothetical protein